MSPRWGCRTTRRIKKGVPLSSTLLSLLWGVNYRDICIIVTDVLPAFVARTIYVPGVSEDALFQSFQRLWVEALLCSEIITIFNSIF